MPSLGRSIQASVGQRPARNARDDQNVIIELLTGISTDDGGPTSQLPPATSGPESDFRLVNAIFNFQRKMVSRGLILARNADGRVDPNGHTILLLNQFTDSGGGGGLLIPIDPRPAPPAGPAQKGPGFLQSMFGKMARRPTNLEISGTGTISGSLFEGGFITGSMSIADIRFAGVREKLSFGGVGLSLGPLPFGVEIAPSAFPSFGSRIQAGPRTVNTVMDVSDLTGVCVIIGASINPGIPAGSNASTILFNVGSNRSLRTLAADLFNSVGPNVAINFTLDAFNTCRAFGSTTGVFAGVSVGVSLMEVVMKSDGPPIRPDPSGSR
jgi:hypothetical protein